MNFTRESIMILVVFFGLTSISVIMSLPYIFRSEEEIEKKKGGLGI